MEEVTYDDHSKQKHVLDKRAREVVTPPSIDVMSMWSSSLQSVGALTSSSSSQQQSTERQSKSKLQQDCDNSEEEEVDDENADDYDEEYQEMISMIQMTQEMKILLTNLNDLILSDNTGLEQVLSKVNAFVSENGKIFPNEKSLESLLHIVESIMFKVSCHLQKDFRQKENYWTKESFCIKYICVGKTPSNFKCNYGCTFKTSAMAFEKSKTVSEHSCSQHNHLAALDERAQKNLPFNFRRTAIEKATTYVNNNPGCIRDDVMRQLNGDYKRIVGGVQAPRWLQDYVWNIVNRIVFGERDRENSMSTLIAVLDADKDMTYKKRMVNGKCLGVAMHDEQLCPKELIADHSLFSADTTFSILDPASGFEKVFVINVIEPGKRSYIAVAGKIFFFLLNDTINILYSSTGE